MTGQAIGYDEAGEGVKTPIVFLHGVGSDRSVWLRQLVHFGHERRSIALDYPGYGDSDPAGEDTTRDDYAAAVLAAMSQLGVYRAHICGLSLGGVVAIAMHDAAPERCASLVLADTFAVHPDGQAIYERSLAGSSDMRVLADSRVDVLLAQPAEPAVRSEVVKTMSAIDPDAYRIGARAVWLADQRERAERHPRADPGDLRQPGPRHSAGAVPCPGPVDPRRSTGGDRRRRPPRQYRAAGRVRHARRSLHPRRRFAVS